MSTTTKADGLGDTNTTRWLSFGCLVHGLTTIQGDRLLFGLSPVVWHSSVWVLLAHGLAPAQLGFGSVLPFLD